MPELPEVETVKRALEKRACGQTIETFSVERADFFLQGSSLAPVLAGKSIQRFERRGKFLAMFLDETHVVMHHLGMSGRLLMCAQDEPVLPHTHLLVTLRDSCEQIRQRDPRRFGFAAIFTREQLDQYPSWINLGPDPMTVSSSVFVTRFAGRAQPIKNCLLNQNRIAGMGNIYVDESLFRAGIHPLQPAGSLRKQEYERLLSCMKTVLQEAIAAGGTSTSDFQKLDGTLGEFQHKHRVYRRTGLPCIECGRAVSKIVLGGRSTHFCKQCQPLRKRKRGNKSRKG